MKILEMNSFFNVANKYRISYENNGKLHTLSIKLSVSSFNNLPVSDEFYRLANGVNWISNKADAVWITNHEFLIPIKSSLETIEAEDRVFSLALIRYYVENHFDSEFSLDAEVSDISDKEFNIDDFRIALINYIN